MSRIIDRNCIEGFAGCTLCYGHFNSIHPGHLRYLKYAAEFGNSVVVAVIGDSESGVREYPFTQIERVDSLVQLGLVDGIYLLEGSDPIEAIKKLQPQRLVLGHEFEGHSYFMDSRLARLKRKPTLIYHSGPVQLATTELLSEKESTVKRARLALFRKALDRHSLSKSDLYDSMSTWSSARLTVIGDTVVDDYAACEALGMSAEAPVIVVRELACKPFLGGAAIVAANSAALGGNCNFVSVAGCDAAADYVEKELVKTSIPTFLVRDNSRPTTYKKRYIVENQKLFRVSRLKEHAIESGIQDEVVMKIEQTLPNSNGVVISDFSYGLLTPRVVEHIKYLAQKLQVPVFADSQCSTQTSSIMKYKGCALLCPNERELRLSMQDKDSGLEALAQQLMRDSGCKSLVVKLASEGLIVYERSGNGRVFNQSFPALSANPLDVTGAGDSLLAAMALGLSARQPLMVTAALATCVAALAVETLGNVPVSVSALGQFLKEIFEYENEESD